MACALQILLLVLFGVGRKYDGIVEIEIDPGGIKRVNLVVHGDPETLLETKEELLFQVKKDES
jgi:hypothetical protein